jgi:glutamate racemase
MRKSNLFFSGVIIPALIISGNVLINSCRTTRGEASVTHLIPAAQKAIYDSSSVYYADFKSYPEDKTDLPIGVFDSGTGGLTVLEAMLSLDRFNNNTGETGSDGIPDFKGEKFIYLGDQANMPYGNYAAEKRTDYLKELVINDALFLTKQPHRCKSVVIACNTATAYAYDDVDNMLIASGTGVKVTGVINAASIAAVNIIKERPSMAVGVMATVGTIASGGYERTLKKMASDSGFSSDLKVVNQGGLGFAESVDGEYDYIDREAKGVRDNYRGPKTGTDSLSVNPDLMDIYNFDRSGNALLVRSYNGKINEIQLNSPGNYARFHLVSLIEKFRKSGNTEKIGTIILGCTHYPYFIDTLKACLKELRNYSKDGKYPYRDIIDEKADFLDPSEYVAIEVYKQLKAEKLIHESGNNFSVEPYISVPLKSLPQQCLDKNGNLTYEYKYGREAGKDIISTGPVPFTRDNIGVANIDRIRRRLPLTFSLIKSFSE